MSQFPSTQNIGVVEADDCIKITISCVRRYRRASRTQGAEERDPIRGQDSFNTFREILQLGVENNVDMILLGGDLFHENKPSRSAMYQTTAMLREHCLSNRPVELEVISDAGFGLGRSYNFPNVNYEDTNLNVGIPVFSIHGNHDDPVGTGPDGALCALDVLAASGLVNYFGRLDLPGGETTADDQAAETGMHIKPVLLRKGRTCLAMYGIGNIRDERFHAEMRKNRISMYRPAQTPESWFNLLVVHQNRVGGTGRMAVPENGFDDEVHLVVWGHEHECRIVPEEVSGKDYKIVQPGSSVATSLAPGEAIAKHVAIVKIQDKAYNIEPIPLRTVRPFLTDEIFLEEKHEEVKEDLHKREVLAKFLKSEVNRLIKQANAEWDEAHVDSPDTPRMLPLIRLKVNYNQEFSAPNPQRLGQEFAGKIANPKDVVHFVKRKIGGARKKVTIDAPGEIEMEVDEEDEADFDATQPGKTKLKMEDLVRSYLKEQKLAVIAENGMQFAVEKFVEKDDRDAIKAFIKSTVDDRAQYVDNLEHAGGDSDAEIENEIVKGKDIQRERIAKAGGIEDGPVKGKGKAKAKVVDFDQDSDASIVSSVAAKKTTAKGKAKKKADSPDPFDDDEEEDDPPPKKKAPAKKAAAKAPAKKAKDATPSQQSTLNFGRAGTGRAAATKGAKKTKRAMDEDSSSDD